MSRLLSSPSAVGHGASGARDAVRGVWRLILLWRQRYATRRDLRDLPPHMLLDIGIDAPHAAREARKPFWQA